MPTPMEALELPEGDDGFIFAELEITEEHFNALRARMLPED